MDRSTNFSGSKEVDELAVRDAVREAIEGCGTLVFLARLSA